MCWWKRLPNSKLLSLVFQNPPNTWWVSAWNSQRPSQDVFGGPNTDPHKVFPIGSMYGIFAYIWLNFVANVFKYTIHGSYGFGRLGYSNAPPKVSNLYQETAASSPHIARCMRMRCRRHSGGTNIAFLSFFFEQIYPPKMNGCPMKRDRFKRKVHLPTIHVSGAFWEINIDWVLPKHCNSGSWRLIKGPY